jgi:hypothetical protein
MKALRLLILSEQNNPDWISVPLVGYRHAEALGRLHQVHLVTHVRNRPAHEARRGPFTEITYIDLGWIDTFYEWMFEKIFKGDFGSQALTAVRVPFYLVFEWLAWRLLKNRIKRQDYDCVLRLTPVAPVLPSPWARWLRSTRVPLSAGGKAEGMDFEPPQALSADALCPRHLSRGAGDHCRLLADLLGVFRVSGQGLLSSRKWYHP